MNLVKELEELLNTFDGVQAYDGEDAPTDIEGSIVFITYGNDIENPNIYEMVNLTQCLADIIAKSCRDMGIQVSMEWMSNSYPTIVIEVHPSRMSCLVNAISCMPREFFCNNIGKR